ncbi:DUF2218 domain-containing protein [Vibrio paucivorans]
MKQSYTMIESKHAEKYLTVLCRHFARKVPATWDEKNGKVEFPMGVTTMQVESSGSLLRIRCKSDSEQGLAMQQSVINSHVDMFARRETLKLVWQAET